MSFPHAENFTRWLGHLRGQVNSRGLELGTFRGESAEWLLDNILTDLEAKLVCVDTWEGGEDHKDQSIDWAQVEAECRKRLSRFRSSAKLWKDDTRSFFKEILVWEPHYDFVYVDASHTSFDVLRDAVLAFECLKPNGVMIFDDYKWGWDKPTTSSTHKPKMAIDAFLDCYCEQIEVLMPVDWQVAVRKRNEG